MRDCAQPSTEGPYGEVWIPFRGADLGDSVLKNLCGGTLRVIAEIYDPDIIQTILEHSDAQPPPIKRGTAIQSIAVIDHPKDGYVTAANISMNISHCDTCSIFRKCGLFALFLCL